MQGGARLLEIMIFAMVPSHDKLSSQRLRCTLKGQGDTERGTCLPVRCTCLRAGMHRQAQTALRTCCKDHLNFFTLFSGVFHGTHHGIVQGNVSIFLRPRERGLLT